MLGGFTTTAQIFDQNFDGGYAGAFGTSAIREAAPSLPPTLC